MRKQYSCECGKRRDRRAKTCRECFLKRDESDKTCTQCKRTLPLSEFGIRTRRSNRPRSVCKACEAKWTKENRLPIEHRRKIKQKWEEDNTDKVYAQRMRARCRQKCLSEELVKKISDLLINQDSHPCQICGTICDSSIAIDHCHETGIFRGLLCKPCNNGLGHFMDDPDILAKAISYLAGVEQQ